MAEVAICANNIEIPALGAGILFQGERLKHPAEYLCQHLSVVANDDPAAWKEYCGC